MATKYEYDVEGAREAGLSDNDIADYLAKKTGYDIAGARKAGLDNIEIIDYLTGPTKREEETAKTEAPPPEKPVSGTVGGVLKAVGQSALSVPGKAAEIMGSTLEVGALVDKVASRRQGEVYDKVKAGEEIKPGLINMAGTEQGSEDQPPMNFGPVAGRGDAMRRQELIWANQYKAADPEQRAAMEQHAKDVVNAPADLIQSTGQAMRRGGEAAMHWAEKAVPLTDEEKSRTSVQFVQMAAGMVPYLAAAISTGGAGAFAYGLADGLNRTYTEAVNSGADPERAAVGAVQSGVVNAVLNLIPAGQATRLFEKLPPSARNKFLKGLTEAALGATNQIGMSQINEIAENAIAAKTYEPDRPWDKNLGEGLGLQAAVGASVPLTAMALGAGARWFRGRRPVESPRTKTTEEVGKSVMDAPTTDDAINVMRETLSREEVDQAIATYRGIGDEAADQQADILQLHRGMSDGQVQTDTAGNFYFEDGNGKVSRLQPWDGGERADTIPTALADSIRNVYGRMGLEVVFIDDANTRFDGAFDKSTGKIFLSTKPDRNGAQVAAHELGHALLETRVEGGTNLSDEVYTLIREKLTEAGWDRARELFGKTAPKREAFAEGPDGDARHVAAVERHLVTEMGAELLSELPKLETFIPAVIDRVQTRYGADVAKNVLQTFLSNLRDSMTRLREFFFKPEAFGDSPPPPAQIQHYLTNMQELFDAGVTLYAERFGTQAERENAQLMGMRKRAQRERMLQEFETPTTAEAMRAMPEGVPANEPVAQPRVEAPTAEAAAPAVTVTVEPQRPSGPPLPPSYTEAVQKAATYRRWLGELDAQRRADAPESPEARALQAQIDSILGKVRGNEDRLTNVARDRLEAARTALDEVLNPVGDSPQMARVRAALEAEQARMADAAGVGTPSPSMERALRPAPSRRAPRPRAPVEIRGEAIMPPRPEVAPAEPVISAPQNEPLRPVSPEPVISAPEIDPLRPVPAPEVRPAAPAESVPSDVRTPAPERAPFDPSLQRFDDLREEGTLTWEPPVEWQPSPEELSTARRLSRGWTPEVELRRPQSLSEFVRKNGGISMDTPEGGDMRAADLNRLPGLLRRQGVQADWMAQRARDAGYEFGRDTEYGSGVNVDAFLNALIEDGGGRKKHYPDNHDTEAWRQQQAHMAELHNYISDVIDLRPKDMDPRRIAWILRQEPEAAKTLSLAERADRLSRGGSIELARRLDADRAQAERDMMPEPGAWEMADHRDLPSPTREEVERYYGEFQAAAGANRASEPVAPQGRPASETEAANRFLASTRSEGADASAEVSRAGSRGDNALVGDRLEPLYSPRQGDGEPKQKARDIQTGPDGRSKLFDDDVARWRDNHQSFLAKGREGDALILRENYVLRALTGERGAITIPPKVAQAIAQKHPDVMASVWRNLPELLADPKAIYPHRDGGMSVVINATTGKGEPILVGVRDNSVHTITPLHNTPDATGLQRLATQVQSSIERGEKVYGETAAFLSQLTALPREQWDNSKRRGPVAQTPDEQSGGRLARNVLTREDVIKSQDRVFYSPRQERPLLDIREATPEELAARQRRTDKELAEANMRGRQVAKKPQESAEDLPIFGGQRQADMFRGEEPAPKPKQGTLFSPRQGDERFQNWLRDAERRGETTAREAVRSVMAGLDEGNPAREVLGKIAERAGDTPVRFLPELRQAKNGNFTRGLFTYASDGVLRGGERGEITVRAGMTPELTAHVLAHESAHAVTTHALAQSREFRADLQVLARAVEKQHGESARIEYGISANDAREFLAEAMTSSSFQYLLRTTPAPAEVAAKYGREPMSLWQTLVNRVATMLGLRKPEQVSALDAAMSIANQAMDREVGMSRHSIDDLRDAAYRRSEQTASYDNRQTGEQPLFSPRQVELTPQERAHTVMDILAADYPALPARSRGVEVIARDLMSRGIKALRDLGVEGGRITGPGSGREHVLLAKAIAAEVADALKRGGNHAGDWYTRKVREAMAVAGTIHPEIVTDPHQAFGFKAALAITSQNETVPSNVRLAEQVYAHFKETGRFPTNVVASKQVAMNTNFKKLNKLLDILGDDGAREFMNREFTVRDLEAAGWEIGGENKETRVYGSAILGPKIGQGFYQNLNGNYQPVTMDLWFMRAWGRLTGTLVGLNDVSKQTARFEAALKADKQPVPANIKTLEKIAERISRQHESDFRKYRAEYDSGERSKSELVYAAERLLAGLNGINETPTSGGQRDWMRAVVNSARRLLAFNGIRLSNADLQAVWWYPEKDLYAKLGGRDSDSINVSYAEALRDLAAKKGVSNGEIERAVRALDRGPGSAGRGADDGRADRAGRAEYGRADEETPLRPDERELQASTIPDDEAPGVRRLDVSRDALFSPRQGEDRDLLIQHNLTAANLAHADRMGGIPVPSLAVTRSGRAMTNFGEITLLGPREMADPRGYAKPKVYGSDIYSPRYPDVVYKFDRAQERQLRETFAEGEKATQSRIDIGSVQDEGARHLERDAAVMWTFLKDQGIEPNVVIEQGYRNKTTYALEKQIRDAGLEEKLSEFAAETMNRVSPAERIFMGFSDSGNRRYIPHTLDNVVRILKKDLRGGETGGNIYGIGQLRSKFTPQFRTVESIRREKGRLVGKEDMEALKKEIDTDFFSIVDELRPAYSYTSDLRFPDTVMAVMEEGATKGLGRALKEYGFNAEAVPEATLAKVGNFLNHLRNMPTEYFEAKILRDVDVAEFKVAVIPDDASQKVRDILAKRGVETVEYKAGDNADRQRVIAEAAQAKSDSVLFSPRQDRQTDLREKYGFRQDNPATRGNTEWLEQKQARADADYAKTRGIQGATTGWLERPVELPTTMLVGLKGARGENRVPGEPQYDALSDAVRKNGWKQDQTNPILVEVNHRGEAFITEGNTRVKVAANLGETSVWAEVKWLNGGEEVNGAWSPDRLLGKLDDRNALFSPRVRAAGTDGYTDAQRQAAERVRGIEGRSLVDRIAEIRQNLGTKIVREIVDPYVGVKERDAAGYLALRNANSVTGAVDMFNTYGPLRFDGSTYATAGQTGGPVGLIRDLGADAVRFMDWVAANRAERLKAEDRENLYTGEDIKILKTLNQGQLDADYTLANGKTTRSREVAYLDALKRLDTINKNARDIAVESGLVKRGVVDALWSDPYYVPFYRQAEEDGSRRFVGSTPGMTSQTAGKALKGGSERLNQNLWQNAFGNWAHMIDAAIRNKAANQVLMQAEADGIVGRVSAADYDNKMTKAEKADVVWTMVDGEKQYWRVDDPMTLKAVAALDYVKTAGPFMDIARGAKKLLQTGVAASPLFQVRNLIRDTENSIAVSPISLNVFKNLADGATQIDVANSLRNVARAVANQDLSQARITKDTADAIAGGATMRYAAGVDQSFTGADAYLDSPGKLAKFQRYFSRVAQASTEAMGAGENFNRLALYRQLGEGDAPLPHDVRAYQGRDLSDFTLIGASPVIRALVDVVPYMNAWMQGLYKVGRAAADADKNVGLAVGGRVAAQITTRLAVVMAGMTALNMALDAIYADDKDYQNRSEYDKNSNFWFKVGGTEFRIPMGFEVAALSRLSAIWLETLYDKNMTAGRAWKNTLQILGTQMAFNPTPQAVKPIIDLAMNESRTGAPIETAGMERLRPEFRATAQTTEVSKGLSEASNKAIRWVFGQNARGLSPVQMDYLAQAYAGWLGTSALQIADTAVRSVSDRPPGPATDWLEKVTGGMVSETPTSQKSGFYVNLLYQQGDAIQEAYNTFQDLAKRGRTAEAREYLEDNRDLIKKYPIYSQTIRLEGEINQQIRTVTESKTLTPEQKRVRIMQLNAMKTRAAENVFRAVNP